MELWLPTGLLVSSSGSQSANPATLVFLEYITTYYFPPDHGAVSVFSLLQAASCLTPPPPSISGSLISYPKTFFEYALHVLCFLSCNFLCMCGCCYFDSLFRPSFLQSRNQPVYHYWLCLASKHRGQASDALNEWIKVAVELDANSVILCVCVEPSRRTAVRNSETSEAGDTE